MKVSVRNIFVSLLFIFFINLNGFGQSCTGPGSGGCGPGRLCCNGQCVTANTCAPGNPPPPGLVVPIDSNISILIISGIGLGVYFFAFQRKKETA